MQQKGTIRQPLNKNLNTIDCFGNKNMYDVVNMNIIRARCNTCLSLVILIICVHTVAGLELMMVDEK